MFVIDISTGHSKGLNFCVRGGERHGNESLFWSPRLKKLKLCVILLPFSSSPSLRPDRSSFETSHEFSFLCVPEHPLPILIQTLFVLHPDYCSKGGLAFGFSALSCSPTNTKHTSLLGPPQLSQLLCLTFRARLNRPQPLGPSVSVLSQMLPSSRFSWPGPPAAAPAPACLSLRSSPSLSSRPSASKTAF